MLKFTRPLSYRRREVRRRYRKYEYEYDSKHSTHLLFERDDPRLYLLQGEVVYGLGSAVGQVREVCAEVCEKLSRDDKANIFIDHYKERSKQRQECMNMYAGVHYINSVGQA